MLSQCGQNANIHVTVLYENIDQILPNKLHGPMHYKIGDTGVYNEHVFYTLCLQWTHVLYSVFTMDTCFIFCVYNGHVFYTLCLQWTLVLYSVVINDGIINPPISQVNSEFMSVWSVFVYNTYNV